MPVHCRFVGGAGRHRHRMERPPRDVCRSPDRGGRRIRTHSSQTCCCAGWRSPVASGRSEPLSAVWMLPMMMSCLTLRRNRSSSLRGSRRPVASMLIWDRRELKGRPKRLLLTVRLMVKHPRCGEEGKPKPHQKPPPSVVINGVFSSLGGQKYNGHSFLCMAVALLLRSLFSMGKGSKRARSNTNAVCALLQGFGIGRRATSCRTNK